MSRLRLQGADLRKFRRWISPPRKVVAKAPTRAMLGRKCNFLKGALLMTMRTDLCALLTRTTNASSRAQQESDAPEGIISATRRGAIGSSRIIFAPTQTDLREWPWKFHNRIHPLSSLSFLQGGHLCPGLRFNRVCGSLALTTKWYNRLHLL